ncbi:MAG TPA: hypothetical protein VMT85_15070 [Thermoanaerobaculia bacterium]|nr:hypothetical protein [Thermoanaerobaculia bacterium]
MILPLRRAHGVLWLGLAIVLPAGLALALWSRPPAVLPTPAAPVGWNAMPGAGASVVPLDPSPFALSVEEDGSLRLLAIGEPDGVAPGLYLYAVGSEVAAGDALPDDAELLGSAEVGAAVRPPPSGSARLVLYSALYETVVGVGEMPAPGSRDR